MSQIPEQLWWTKEPNWKEVHDGLFTVEPKEKQSGYVPFTFGIVVKVPNPRYQTFFYVDAGSVFVASGGPERIFNCVLNEGKHTASIITRTSEDHPDKPNERKWQKLDIGIEVLPRDFSKMGIISNFFQSKKAGQYIPNTSSTGLDVAFSISTSISRENPETLEWNFDECHPSKDPAKPSRLIVKWQKAGDHLSEGYVYKENGAHTGYVKVTYSNGRPAGECKFSVVIGNNKKIV